MPYLIKKVERGSENKHLCRRCKDDTFDDLVDDVGNLIGSGTTLSLQAKCSACGFVQKITLTKGHLEISKK